MQLGLTIPLMRHLKRKSPPYGEPLDRRFCWELHCITLHGRSCMLAVNCASRYTFTLFDLSGADWNDLPDMFLQGMQGSFQAAGISEETISSYLEESGAPEFTKTHGRREAAFLNRAWEAVVALDYTVDQSTQHQPFLDSAVNDIPCRCVSFEGMGKAVERLRLCLSV